MEGMNAKPLKPELSMSASTEPLQPPQLHKPWKALFFLISAVALIGMPLLSRQFGITWDEWFDHNLGHFVWRYLLTQGSDKTYFMFAHGYLYSGLYYTIAAIIYTFVTGNPNLVFGGLYEDAALLPYFTFSHGMNAVAGVLVMFYTGWTIRKLTNWRAGFLAFLFMLLSPRFFGHSMNNPKDIPFAFAYIFCLSQTLDYVKQLPKPRFSTIFLLTLGIVLSIGTRIGGIIQIAYLSLFTGVTYLFLIYEQKRMINPFPIMLTILGVAILGYAGSLFFWPYGMESPIGNLFNAMKEITKFDYGSGTVLFEGKMTPNGALPWYYIPKWIMITIPLPVLIGLAGFPIFVKGILKKIPLRLLWIIIFSAIFPIAYVIFKGSILYDGWRHFIFLYPPLIILSVLSWDQLFSFLGKKKHFAIAWMILAGMLCLPLSWMIRNHPYQTVYFNELVGGTKGAYGKYETDYWGNCIREASEWLGHDYKRRTRDRLAVPIQVRADGSIMSSYPYLRNILGKTYIPYDYPENFLRRAPFRDILYGHMLQGKREWDFSIILSRYWDPALLKKGLWPPLGTIHEVKVDGVTICAVTVNTSKRR